MTRFSLFALSLLLVAACGDDGGGPEVNLSDAAPPVDAAPPPPDAEVCTLTECGSECVDTSNDPLHCGGCNMACANVGEICSGALPCACPDPFVPMAIGGTGDLIFAQSGAIIGLSPIGSAPTNMAIVIWDETLELDTSYDFADSIANTAPPTIAAGYDVDLLGMTAASSYAATEGTIVFDTLCADGASGTISDVVFNAVAGTFDLTPVEGGCSMSYDTLTFDVGSCPQP
jgi:hypothetical protein